MKRIMMLIGFVLLPTALLAGTSEDLLFMEVPTVVTASKQEQSLNDAPAVVTVVSKDEIRKFGANDLHDILNRVASVYTIGNQYLNIDGNTSIRGDLIYGQDLHVLVLLNGRPLRDDATGGYDMAIYEGFPIDAIERIEVIRGPGSVLYGSNAFTGVINIITHKAESTTVKVTGGAGLYGTSIGSALCDVKKGDLAIMGSAKYFAAKGWNFSAVDANRVGKTIDFSKNNLGLDVTVDYKNLSVNMFGSLVNDAGMGTRPAWAADGTHIDSMDDWFFINAGYKQDLSKNWRAEYNVSYQYTNFHETNQLQTTHKGVQYMGEATLFGTLSDKLGLTVGGIYEKMIQPERGNVVSVIRGVNYYDSPITPVEENDVSAYAELNYKPFNFLKTNAGVQYNQPYNGYPGVVPRLGVVANINDNLGVKLLYGQAFRSPALIEKYLLASVLQGNPNLQAETITNTDLQVFYNQKKYQAALTLFTSKYNNMITRDPSKVPPSYMNAGGVAVNGAELEGKTSLRSNLSLLGSLSYQKNKSDSNIDDFMQISNSMAKLGIMYDATHKLSFGVFDQFYAKPPDVSNVNPARLLVNTVPDAYNWLTLNVTYKVSERLELSAYGTNLLNSTVYYPEFGTKSINSLPGQPGTGVYVKASITL